MGHVCYGLAQCSSILLGSWAAPMSGQRVNRPPPCGAHTMTKFDPSRALYFGGRRETGYTNEAYILDLNKKVCLRFSHELLKDKALDTRLLPINTWQ